jgi:hypothetical protein
MTVAAPQTVQITCPNCRTPFQTQIFSIVDVQQQPILKQALLAGQLNVAVCPRCGAGSMLGVPLIYHDAEKQLCLIYFPQELNASTQEQERYIGDATNLLIRGLPADAPRGYLLNPRRFITLNSLIDAIFEADGVTKEMLEAQRKRVDIIAELANAMQNESELAKVVEKHKAALDADFFMTLLAFAQANAQQGQPDSAQMLLTLRQQVATLAGFDLSTIDGETDENFDAAQNEALERLSKVSDEELEDAVAELRPLIDYSFFQVWTNRIENAQAAGDSAEAQRLTDRRARIIELVEAMDAKAQAMFEKGTAILQAVVDAEDLEAALRAQGDAIDASFLMVLGVNTEAAMHNNNAALVERFQKIAQIAKTIIEEKLSPEDRFISELLSCETPQESTKLLRRNVAKVTPKLIQRLNELADENKNSPDSERLRQFAREAGAMLF